MNKKFYSFGMAAMMLLLSGNVMATDYYISANGNDTNDGKTAATPLKTLSAVMAKVVQNRDGEHVYVSGIIKVDAEWTKAHLKNVIFEGTNPETDGFDAEGKNGIFNINNSDCIFKNLSFRNGYKAANEAGAGAIWGFPLRLTLDNCVFEGNKVENTNSNLCGGAIFVNQTKTSRGEFCGVFASNTKFVNNSTKASGAAIVAVTNILDLKNCYFLNNAAENAGGAIYANQETSVIIDGCAFENNESTTNRGGAICTYMGALADKVYIISNSTFYKNRAKGEGGAFSANDDHEKSNNTINFVHCTMTGNATQGTVEGAGGIAISKRPGTVNIVNSILQGNLAETNANQFADATFQTTKVNFVNSYVGSIRQFDNNKADYYTFNDKSVLNNLTRSNQEIDLAAYDADAHIIRLKATSDAKSAADLSADAAYGVTTDQLGQAWTKPYVGAVQLLEGESTGISGIKTDAPKSLKGIYNIAGQYVGNDAFKLAKGLYIIGGKKVVVK